MALPHLFLSIYSCDPAFGSELTVGWHRLLHAARDARVWAVTEDRGQQARVDAGLAEAGLADRVRLRYLAHDAIERRAMDTPGGFYWAYRRWQRRALCVAQGVHDAVGLDLLHHVNMVGYREPGFLYRLAAEAGIPLVLGPVGGTQNMPAAFAWRDSARAGAVETARTIANDAQLRLARRFHAAARQATTVLAATSTGVADLKRVGIDADRLLETGAPPAGTARRWAERAPGPVRVLWASEFIYRKGLDLMLDAHQRLRASGLDVHLHLLGDGPLRGLVPADDPTVHWDGRIPREAVLARYQTADVFAFTSVRDTSGNVMLEALAAGLPVVYLDHQGAHDMGSAACGVPVPVRSPDQVADGLAAGIRKAVAHPETYDALSAGAIARAKALAWDVNAQAMAAIYQRALSANPSTPDLTDDDDARPAEPTAWNEAALRVATVRPLVSPVWT